MTRHINRQLLGALLFSLAIPPLLYFLRGFDDNALCRWKWVLSDIQLSPYIMLLIATASIPLYLCRFSWTMPRPAMLFGMSFLFGTIFWSEPVMSG